ncbi:EAL domain-containing protein [Vibrio sp. Isolate25]|uniref:putative bifunctional diguanylate cyclase/phosphodiesterase n=1 Tax=Vibrio sp. Isolate25 TaxID=2908535 RepID=UPI001EFE3E71|nr:EAL domain-containing protein [Vibrio sp. Isolate25]MCG9596406.1 EAL domain-containing protein [Vibrio sp. Isolate25]
MPNPSKQTATLLELMSGIVGAIPNGLITFSESGEVNLVNTAALSLLGLENKSPKDFLDRHYYSLLADVSDVRDKIDRLLLSGKHSELEVRNVVVDGQSLNIQCYSMLKGVLIVISEISDETALLYRENNDMLTQLNNRQFFETQFLELVSQTNHLHQNAALAFFDIDNFKTINDSFGHSLGDEVLCKIANILKSRTSKGQPIARIGGDQFAVLLDDYTVHEAQGFADDVRKHIDAYAFNLDENSVRITVSSGVAPFYTNAAPELTKLLSIANTACKAAKDHGRNRTHIIDAKNDEFESYIRGVKWIEEINKAIQEERFVLYCQKISPISDNSVPFYYEVLLRLKNEQGEVISPCAFLPIAERYHMMPDIDRYVMTALFSSMGSRSDRTYSVNLSGQTISDYSLVDFVNKMLNRYVFNPRCIIFEVTETAAMRDFHGTIEVMHSLRALGFQFSLDDFGTGLSSFTYLKELPLDTVKIDGSFVRDIEHDKISYQMVKSIHEIGQAMGLKTVAEFVENKAIYQCLSDIGVHFAQGYYIHKPEPITDIMKVTAAVSE